MSTDRILNAMRREAGSQASGSAKTRLATVTGYDPSHYAAKVTIQPDGIETGWLPVTSPWIGNQWGFYAPPSIGDQVEVHFQEGDRESGFVVQRLFDSEAVPLAVPSGEFWLVHASGTYIKLRNSGDIEIHAAGKVTGVAQEWDITGNVNVTGDLLVTGEIRDHDGLHGTIGHIRDVYDIHTHAGIQPGSGNTAIPNQLLPD